MKKLFFASVMSLGMVAAVTAQTEDKEPTAMNETSVEVVAMTKDAPATIQDFKEINVAELPQPVKDAVAKTFENATVENAYKNEKGEFKLVVSTSDDSLEEASQTVYLNSKGEWIKKQ